MVSLFQGGCVLAAAFDRNRKPAWREYALFGLLLGALALAAYGNVLNHCYGLRDDYIYLWMVRFGFERWFDLISAMGRPLYQWLSEVLFAYADSLCRLAAVRGLTLASAVLFGLHLHGVARHAGWAPLEAFALAALGITTPAVGLYIGWAITFPFILAMSLGMAAGGLALHGRLIGQQCLAVGLLYGALTIYQHSAMAYGLAVALAVFTPGRIDTLPWRRLLRAGGLFGLTLLFYYGVYRWQLAQLMAADPEVMKIGAVRTQWVDDIAAKLMFLGQSLMLAASLGQFVSRPWLAISVLMLALIGLLTALKRRPGWQGIVLWCGLPLAVYLPSVVVAENQLKVRLIAVLGVLSVLYVAWALTVLLPRRIVAGLLLVVAGYSTVAAHIHVDRDIVQLHVAEGAAVTAALRRRYTADAERIAIVRPPARNLVTGGSPLIEYGTPTAAPYPDFARVLVQQLFGEIFRTDRLPEVVQCPEPAQRDCSALAAHPELPVIDLPRLYSAFNSVPR